MASKTRDKLIEVARQLFARKGVENTTMLDIANASEKGRRTIYTYFKNKREIHQAVIERESEQIVSRQRQILQSDATAAEKLRQFLEARFRILICPTDGGEDSRCREDENVPLLLRIDLSLDMRRAQKARRLAVRKEIEILRQILDRGVADGEFSRVQAARAMSLIIVLMQGVDSSSLADHLALAGTDTGHMEQDVIAFVTDALGN